MLVGLRSKTSLERNPPKNRLESTLADYGLYFAGFVAVAILALGSYAVVLRKSIARLRADCGQSLAENVRLTDQIQAISRQELTQKENELARSVLKRFVARPEPFERRGLRIASAFRDSSTVSGDFYNWFTRTDGSVCIYLVDVEGHGIEAAIQATHVAKVLERTVVRGDIEQASSLLEKADRVIHDELQQPNVAVTMNLVEIDTRNRKIRLANAGMPPPLLFRYGQAQPEPLQAAGVHVGGGYSRFLVKPRQIETSVEEGDLLVLFSDGVTEATGADGKIFGNSGVAAAVAMVRDEEPSAIADAVLQSVAAHSGSPNPQDDQAVVAVRLGSAALVPAGAKGLSGNK